RAPGAEPGVRKAAVSVERALELDAARLGKLEHTARDDLVLDSSRAGNAGNQLIRGEGPAHAERETRRPDYRNRHDERARLHVMSSRHTGWAKCRLHSSDCQERSTRQTLEGATSCV